MRNPLFAMSVDAPSMQCERIMAGNHIDLFEQIPALKSKKNGAPVMAVPVRIRMESGSDWRLFPA
jgi:kynurenine formamidase